MQKIKNESGITLLVLVITIIVILILAGVSITTGNVSIETSKDENNQASLSIVQQAVITQYAEARSLNQLNIVPNADFSNKPSIFVGTLIDNVSSINATGISWVINSFTYYEDYYYRLSPENLEKLGVKNSECNYVVNYKTGEVYNETKKVTSQNENLYITSLKSVQNNYDTVDTTFSNDE